MEAGKVVWCSRHQMTPEQNREFEGKVVETMNIVWQATNNAADDKAANGQIWKDLSVFETVAGVFPPVALEALPKDFKRKVVTPVSRQAPELRTGDGPIPFVHLRWVTLHDPQA